MSKRMLGHQVGVRGVEEGTVPGSPTAKVQPLPPTEGAEHKRSMPPPYPGKLKKTNY